MMAPSYLPKQSQGRLKEKSGGDKAVRREKMGRERREKSRGGGGRRVKEV